VASFRKSITKAGTTLWQAVWAEPKAGGGSQRRTKNFGSQKEARVHALQMEVEVERRGVGDPHKHNLERYLARWLATLASRGEHSPTTLAGYRKHIERACQQLGQIPLEKVTPADLDDLYTALLRRGLTARTVLNMHRVLHTALGQAYKWRMVKENAAHDATAPTPRKTSPKAFTADEVARLLAAAEKDREIYTMIATLLVSAIRRSELLALAADAVDVDSGTLTVKRVVLAVDNKPMLRDVTKTSSSARTLTIPPALVDLLRAQRSRTHEAALAWGAGYRREPWFLFARPDGEPLNPHAVTVRLRKVMHRAGISVRPPTHGWRHTAATLLISGGTDVKTVQTRLGHATPTITLALYVHPTKERDAAAGEQLAGWLKR